MSILYSFIVTASLLFSVASIPYGAIETAFEKGDASKIVSMGEQKMLINIAGTEGVYGQTQATQVLKSFFDKNPCSSFSFQFKGDDSGSGSFAIGNYKSRSGKFRVTIHFKKVSSDFKIETLTIEKD